MSQYDDYDNEYDGQDDSDDHNTPKGLRAALKKAQDELRKAQKSNEDLAAQVSELSKANKSRQYADILNGKGVNPKIAKWIEKDGVDPDESAVQAWLDENAELFNITTNNTTDNGGDGDGQDAETSDDNDSDPFAGVPEELRGVLAAMQNQQAVESHSVSDDGEGTDTSAAIAAIGDNAKSFEDVLAGLNALGAPVKGGY